MTSERPRLSRSEWAVMKQCWTLGQATAREVHDIVGAERGWDHNTTKTLLDRVAAKGLLVSVRSPEGKVSEQAVEVAPGAEAVAELAG